MIVKPSLRSLGSAALFSGVALVVHILSGYSLRGALSVTGAVAVAAAVSRWINASAEDRLTIRRMVLASLVIGVAATLMYDLVKTVLSQFDPSPYNPFEAFHVFGELLVGSNRPSIVIYVAGAGFHLLNGTLFAVAFCFLFGDRGIVAGIGWGLFLELFQLWLYPGWLNIAFYGEFLQISVLAHICYGVVVGLFSQAAWIKFGTVNDHEASLKPLKGSHEK